MVTLNSDSAQTGTTATVDPSGGRITDIEASVTRNYVLMRSYLSWGPIIAGSALTMAFLILSASLAYACGVPVNSGGAYGWGAGFWSVITSAIAFFSGGCLASYFASASDFRFRFLHGVMVWGLTLPLLAFVFAGSVGPWYHGGLILGDSSIIHAYASTGAAWGAFFSLTIGLICASIGAVNGSSMHDRMIMSSR